MAECTLTLRATIIAGDRLDDDFCVYFEGRDIGRIMLAQDHVKRVEEWRWCINVPLPIPDWANGVAASLEAAKAQFRAARSPMRPPSGSLARMERFRPEGFDSA